MFPVDENGNVATANIDYVETWKAMEAVHLKGKAKAIGVSNFSQHEMNRLLEEGSVVPAVHQMECHPLLAQHGFNAWHKEKGIHVTQYNPFSKQPPLNIRTTTSLLTDRLGNANPYYSQHPNVGKLLDDPVMIEKARGYGKSTAQIALAWGLAHRRYGLKSIYKLSLAITVSLDLTITGVSSQSQRQKDAFEPTWKQTSNSTVKTWNASTSSTER